MSRFQCERAVKTRILEHNNIKEQSIFLISIQRLPYVLININHDMDFENVEMINIAQAHSWGISRGILIHLS